MVVEFFTKHPNKDIPHPQVVDWVVSQYKKKTGGVFRDPDRAIRKLSQEGWLIKVRKGVYRYDPEHVTKRALEDFTPAQKVYILERDGYKCVQCGRGKAESMELHIDHIVPKDKGGKATIENGQILCSQHNFIKKNLNQTESGKKMFIRLYELSKVQGNTELTNFAADVLKVFEQHDINGHIEWKQ